MNDIRKIIESVGSMAMEYLKEHHKENALKELDILESQNRKLWDLKNEINCRWEHGADGKEHLQYIENQINGMLL